MKYIQNYTDNVCHDTLKYGGRYRLWNIFRYRKYVKQFK